jgi:hypothetical protein
MKTLQRSLPWVVIVVSSAVMATAQAPAPQGGAAGGGGRGGAPRLTKKILPSGHLPTPWAPTSLQTASICPGKAPAHPARNQQASGVLVRYEQRASRTGKEASCVGR